MFIETNSQGWGIFFMSSLYCQVFLAKTLRAFVFKDICIANSLRRKRWYFPPEQKSKYVCYWVNKDNVSLWSKGRTDLFASLSKIKISYIPGYSVVMQIHSMYSHPLDHSVLSHGPWDLKSKGNLCERKPHAVHISWVINSFVSGPQVSCLLPQK